MYALLISSDELVITQFKKFCAITQTELRIEPRLQQHDLREAYRVFIDQNVLVDNFSHSHTVVVTHQTNTETWQLAARLNAEHVAVFANSQKWFLDHLVTPHTSRALTVLVTPAVGGAGATTLSCALASQFSHQGLRTCLIDGDYVNGNTDVLMGAEYAEGMRWNDVNNLIGQVSGSELLSALPHHEQVHLLAFRGNEPRSPKLNLMQTSQELAGACDVLIIDGSGLHDEITQQMMTWVDHVLIAMTTTVQACSAVSRAQANPLPQSCGLVIREIAGSGLTPSDIAQTLELPLRAVIPTDVRVVEQIEQGLGLGRVSLGGFTRAIHSLSERVQGQQGNEYAA